MAVSLKQWQLDSHNSNEKNGYIVAQRIEFWVEAVTLGGKVGIVYPLEWEWDKVLDAADRRN